MTKLFRTLLCAALLAACTSACYRMPTNDDYSLIPSTNNPDFTRERGSNNNPGVRY